MQVSLQVIHYLPFPLNVGTIGIANSKHLQLASFLISLQCVCSGLPEHANLPLWITYPLLKYPFINLMGTIIFLQVYSEFQVVFPLPVLSLLWVCVGLAEDVSCHCWLLHISPWLGVCLAFQVAVACFHPEFTCKLSILLELVGLHLIWFWYFCIPSNRCYLPHLINGSPTCVYMMGDRLVNCQPHPF